MANEDPRVNSCDPYSSGGVAWNDWLRRHGLRLRTPADVAPNQQVGCLWELIYTLAAGGVFLHSTDHLSDQQLYQWLHDSWMRRPCSDHGERPHRDCLVTPVEAESEGGNELWLRYYAGEEERHFWSRAFPEDAVPEHKAPQYDRDRWLPAPVASVESVTDEDGVDEARSEEWLPAVDAAELDDPLNLAGVDEAIHSEWPGQGSPATPFVDESDLAWEGVEVDEDAMEPAVDVTTEGWTTPHEELARAGVILPAPAELSDEDLPPKLWELLHALACRGFYLLHTNHLSDRELYALLWNDSLWTPAILSGRSSIRGWFHDCLGGGTDEARTNWLRCYASDDARADHARMFPGETLPPRLEHPSRRDHRLPQGPFGIA